LFLLVLSNMQSPLRRPEEILAYRSLRQMLGSVARPVWAVAPSDTAFAAINLMSERDIGFVPVLESGRLVGVLSERDCVRAVMLTHRPADATAVGDVMVRNVVTADLSHTFGDCLRMMHQNRIRHLPVVESGKVIAVISIRDLMSEAVSHHAKIIEQLERERLTMFTSTV
jgi:CBS domain-containing protein